MALECSGTVSGAPAKTPGGSGVDYVCHLAWASSLFPFGAIRPHALHVSQGRAGKQIGGPGEGWLTC